MRRRDFLASIGGAAMYSRLARAESSSVATIGILYAGRFATNPTGTASLLKGLADMGYVEGANLKIEHREAEDNVDLLAEMARELVRLQVRVIVVGGSTAGALAAKAATSTIPIVFSNAGDPIKSGLVTSLSHPGGNITGITDIGVVLSAKRLELIRLLVPAAKVAGLLIRPQNPVAESELPSARDGARSLGLGLCLVEALTDADIDLAFAELMRNRAEVVCVVPHNLFYSHRGRIAALAARHRLPAIYPMFQFVEAGGLMSYGSSLFDRVYQAGVYTGRILNGADPADLPVRRPTKFELAINPKVASALGLDVPAHVLALADRVVK